MTENSKDKTEMNYWLFLITCKKVSCYQKFGDRVVQDVWITELLNKWTCMEICYLIQSQNDIWPFEADKNVCIGNEVIVMKKWEAAGNLWYKRLQTRFLCTYSYSGKCDRLNWIIKCHACMVIEILRSYFCLWFVWISSMCLGNLLISKKRVRSDFLLYLLHHIWYFDLVNTQKCWVDFPSLDIKM